MEMSQAALDRMKTQPITERQQWAVEATCRRLGLSFRGTTKYDAWEFLDKYYKKEDRDVARPNWIKSKPVKPNNNPPMDNEKALRYFGRKFDEDEIILSNDFAY